MPKSRLKKTVDLGLPEGSNWLSRWMKDCGGVLCKLGCLYLFRGWLDSSRGGTSEVSNKVPLHFNINKPSINGV